MMPVEQDEGTFEVGLSKVWFAYRKAKHAAFRDKFCAHGFKYISFEDNLEENLKRIHSMFPGELIESLQTAMVLGKRRTIPKSVQPPKDSEDTLRFFSTRTREGWTSLCKRKRASAEFRDVIDASVDFQIVDHIWCLTVGARLDEKFSGRGIYANRIRRRVAYLGGKPAPDQPGPVNWESHSLFVSYMWQYGLWKKQGYSATRDELLKGNDLLVFTLDVATFYDSIDPEFLVSPEFEQAIGFKFSEWEKDFTISLCSAFKRWRRENEVSGDIGLPIGLASSGIIANALLAPLDSQIQDYLKPVFYGRYVDDIFLCVHLPEGVKGRSQALEWLASKVPFLKLNGKNIDIELEYAPTTKLKFGLPKQRVFSLRGQDGLRVIQPVIEHMERQSSEHRLIPVLDENEAQLVEKILLLTKDASLEAVSMREMDKLSIRKAGLAEILRKFEVVGDLVAPSQTKEKRTWLFRLLREYLLSPEAFFEFYQYVPRFFALMVRHEDWEELAEAISSLEELKGLLKQTVKRRDSEIDRCFLGLNRLIEQQVIKNGNHRNSASLRNSSRVITQLGASTTQISSKQAASPHSMKRFIRRFWIADWGRRPARETFASMSGDHFESGSIPLEFKEKLFIDQVSMFLSEVRPPNGLTTVNWKPLIFPTRPFQLSTLSKLIPAHQYAQYFSRDAGIRGFLSSEFGKLCLGLAGTRIRPQVAPQAIPNDAGLAVLRVGKSAPSNAVIGVASFDSSDAYWESSATGSPERSLERYNHIAKFLNGAISAKTRPHFFVLPELALPRYFESIFATTMGHSGISLISGLEYAAAQGNKNTVRNEALISLAVGSGYGALRLCQAKSQPAWIEKQLLAQFRPAKTLVTEYPFVLPIFVSRGLAFGVLICSDLTNIVLRNSFQGKVDALFVLEWNRDVPSFASIVEAACLDVHTYIIQANKREFGDSRIRGPYRDRAKRDIVQVRGGVDDYFVSGIINAASLRAFQSTATPDLETGEFKPFPIGFVKAEFRHS